MHIYKPIIPSLFWFHWWFYIIRQSGGWQFLFSVLSDSSVKKGIWITDNPVVSSDKLNSSSPKTILVFPSTVTRKHHCFKMWWQPTLCYWVQQKLECTEQTNLNTMVQPVLYEHVLILKEHCSRNCEKRGQLKEAEKRARQQCCTGQPCRGQLCPSLIPAWGTKSWLFFKKN